MSNFEWYDALIRFDNRIIEKYVNARNSIPVIFMLNP